MSGGAFAASDAEGGVGWTGRVVWVVVWGGVEVGEGEGGGWRCGVVLGSWVARLARDGEGRVSRALSQMAPRDRTMR